MTFIDAKLIPDIAINPGTRAETVMERTTLLFGQNRSYREILRDI